LITLAYRGALPFSAKGKTNTFIDLKFPQQCLSNLEVPDMFSSVEWEVNYLCSGAACCLHLRVQQPWIFLRRSVIVYYPPVAAP
jgi:hypothetical protein